MNSPHQPVLVSEVLSGLGVRPDGIYFDGTVGAGGHAEAILEKLGDRGRLIGVDCDEEILAHARQRLSRFGERAVLQYGRYEELDLILQGLGLEGVDGVLLDLGVSSYQLEEGRRGFSFRREGPLDMRMDGQLGETAADLLAHLSEEKLIGLFREYGEEPRARLLARRIVEGRRRHPLRSTSDLAGLVASGYGRRGKTHPATQAFQALRIAVNQELDRLSRFLGKFPWSLKTGGRAAVISYHSLEDRPVKLAFREWAGRGLLRIVTPKPVRPGREEILRNPRGRSAKLRVAERCAAGELA